MMGGQLGNLFETVSTVITDPTSNLTLAVLLMAVLIIIVLIASASIYLFLVVGSKRSDERAQSQGLSGSVSGQSQDSTDENTSPEPRRKLDRRYLIVGGLVLLATAVLAYGLTGADAFCAESCHADSPAVISAEEDAHVSTTCSNCHEGSGLLAVPANIAWRYQYLSAQFAEQTVDERPVRAENCLECHENILDGIIENEARGLRMEHVSPTEAGMSCEDCHERAGHGTILAAGMNPCLRCHDGEQASADCSVCHLGDPAQAVVYDRPYPKVRVANRDCGACHDLAPCDACHGARMPHSDTFMAYAHAKDAVFERKESCYVCHEKSDCGMCHAAWDSGHGATVAMRKENHRTTIGRGAWSTTAGCTCHAHNPYRNYCALCHEEAEPLF